MKYFLAVCLMIASANAVSQEIVDEFMDRLQEIGGICADETKATSDDIAELIARQMPPSTHEGKCMLFCIQRHLHLMKDDGGVDKAGAIAALNPLKTDDPDMHKKLLSVFVKCGLRVKVSKDPCETATALAICGQEEAKAVNIDDSLLG